MFLPDLQAGDRLFLYCQSETLQVGREGTQRHPLPSDHSPCCVAGVLRLQPYRSRLALVSFAAAVMLPSIVPVWNCDCRLIIAFFEFSQTALISYSGAVRDHCANSRMPFLKTAYRHIRNSADIPSFGWRSEKLNTTFLPKFAAMRLKSQYIQYILKTFSWQVSIV